MKNKDEALGDQSTVEQSIGEADDKHEADTLVLDVVSNISNAYARSQRAYARRLEQEAADAKIARKYRLTILNCIGACILILYVFLLIVLIRMFCCQSLQPPKDGVYLYIVGC